ncbi:MAG: hypothetical protein GX091_05115 [Peptococcaceae bacterium]|nr:hypothetical protein [Peptococcaceae bacterium]
MYKLTNISNKLFYKLLVLIILSSTMVMLISGCTPQPLQEIPNDIPEQPNPEHPGNTVDPVQGPIQEPIHPSEPTVSPISTAALLEKILDSPLWQDKPLCQYPQDSFNALIADFKELQEFMQRKDGAAELLARYLNTDILAPFSIMETMLAQQPILNSLDNSHLQELLSLTWDKYQAKQKLPDVDHSNHLGWLLGKILQQIDYYPFQQQIEKNQTLQDFLTDGVLKNNSVLKIIEQQTEYYLADNNLLPQHPNLDPNQEEFEIIPSRTNPKWNKLKAKVNLSEFQLTENGMQWSAFAPHNRMTNYSFDYPQTWNFDGLSLFYKDNQKIAELAPAAETQIALITIAENYEPVALSGTELLAKKVYTLGKYDILKIIEKFPDYGLNTFCYSYTYLVQYEKQLFTILFYSYDLEKTEEELFDQIVASFQWEKP